MSNAGAKRKADHLNEYEKQRDANIMKNNQRMKELNIQTLVQEVNSSHAHQRKKKTSGNVAAERTEVAVGHNLRSSSRLNAQNVDLQAVNEHPDQQPDGDIEEQPKKNVRGRTTKADIFARQNKPKLEVQVNERGQPCGLSSTEFANFIGALVRTKGFPVAHDDWRKVCPKAKWKLWTDAQLYWKLDASVFNWFMKTASIKWKEFKSDLRKLYDDDMEDDELLALCDERVHEVDWKWLIDHWRSPEAAARSLRGKASRSMLSQNHTSGSKSHARVDHELGKELGRPPRRDELFIKTHTHKTGLPHKGAERTINALKDAIRDHPELEEKTIQEGDAYSHVCGPERNGYVRVIGLGPTPADLEMPGSRKFTSTRLQMEMEARKETDKKLEEVTSRLDKLQEMMAQLIEQQMSSQKSNSTPNGCGNALQRNLRNGPTLVDEELHAGDDYDVASHAGDDMYDVPYCDDDDMIMNSRVSSPEDPRDEGGKDVILYSVVRPYDVPVAKATIQTTNPRAVVAGTPLGAQFCEVVVNHVLW